MLASFVVHVKPLTDVSIPVNTGSLLHAAFLASVGKLAPRLADQLHRNSPTKPFTLSCLQGGRHYNLDTKPEEPQNLLWFRITTLSGDLFSVVDQMLHDYLGKAASISLGTEVQLQVVGVQTASSGKLSWSNVTSFEELYESSRAESEITLRFYSSTTFRQRGKNVPLPLPALAFASYLQRWNTFSPSRFDRVSLLSWVEENVAIGAHRLETAIVPFGRFQLVGFVGTCRYYLLGKDTQKQKALNALADFAFYAGTGAKTTMGMGQTRRLK